MDCSGVIIKLNSVQLQLQYPAGTELGNIDIYNSQLLFYTAHHLSPQWEENVIHFRLIDENASVMYCKAKQRGNYQNL